MYPFYSLFSDDRPYPIWVSALLITSQLLALLTIPSVLVQRQGRPRAALSWLLTLFALPGLGIVAWWAVGRTSIERKRRKRAKSKQRFASQHGIPHTQTGTPFDGLLPPRALGDSMFTTNGNSLELLFDGPAAFPAMEAAIRSARTSIRVGFYIFRADETGRRFRDLLAEKAREGVSVRVLVDAWGSPRFAGRFAYPLRYAGAKVAAFLPSRLMPLVAPRLNFVNHRKIIVVDERVALVGGMNIGDEYRRSWRDVMMRIEGPAVHALDHVFLDDWHFATDEEVPHIERDTGFTPGDASCAIVASGPDREPFIHDAYFTLFTRATKRIWIVTPYFIPTEALSVALRTASGRGVDVRIVLPRRSDVSVAKYAARSYYPELVEAGVEIYEYGGPMLHAKAIVVDDDLSAIGSANVDTRSFRLSFEISCLVSHPATTRRIADWFNTLVDDSHKVTVDECRNRSYPQVLVQSLAHLFSPLL